MDLETYYWVVGFISSVEALEFERLAGTLSNDFKFDKVTDAQKIARMVPLDTSDRKFYYFEKSQEILQRIRVAREVLRSGGVPDLGLKNDRQIQDNLAFYVQNLGLYGDPYDKLKKALGI